MKKILIFLLSTWLTVCEEEEKRVFSYRIISLRDYDFVHQLQIEKKMEKPWVLYFYSPYCTNCMEFVKIYDEIALQGKNKNFYFSAVDCYENEDARDRFVIPNLPALIFINEDGKLYRYEGEFTLQAVSKFVIDDEWKQVQAKLFPKEINYFKRYLRKLTSIKMVFNIDMQMLVLFLICVIIVAIWIFRIKSQKELLEKIIRIQRAQQNILYKKKEYLKLD